MLRAPDVATGPDAGLAAPAQAQQDAVVVQRGIEYARHDGVSLQGDLYRPIARVTCPALVAVHGGGWQVGSRDFYKHWGPYLAEHGYAVFAIDYRLMRPGVSTYPGALYDVKAAVQFVCAAASELGVDPDRIGLMGDSAGAHLAALLALAGNEPPFAHNDRSNPRATTQVNVSSVVGIYGVYDLLAKWEYDQIARPRDQISERFLGASPMVNRKLFFEASPISYATIDKNSARFLLIYGDRDDVAGPKTQSARFLLALRQAGFFARSVVVPGAGHYWVTDPLEPGSFGAYAGPHMLRFLQNAL